MIALVAVGAGIAIGSGVTPLFSSDRSSQPVSQPRISLTEVRIGGFDESDPLNPTLCVDIVGNILPNENNREARASFVIVNSGSIDGFVRVQMIIDGEVHSSNRYFVRADTSVPNSLFASGINCAIEWQEVSVRIADISRN